MARKKLPSSVYNPITLIGAALAALSFGLILFLMLLDALSSEHKPYVGIIAFVILPGFLIIGLLLVAFGIIREHRRALHGKQRKIIVPVIDLNNPKQRLLALLFFSGTIILLLFSAFGSFKAYEYTDSDEFCGKICHNVMDPEYTAYKLSPHSRVGCVKCHIGPGAGWFVRSKLSGAYQVYSAIFDKFPKPIPTPIKNLRPAQETCEQCHWPQHFYSEKLVKNIYYLSDEKNSKWELNLLLKIGGGNVETGPTSGIHWHMNIANQISYIPADSQREIIPWIKVKDRFGNTRVYKSTEMTFDEKKMKDLTERKMDCIDCHNRPTHIYHAPSPSVNTFMSLGSINSSLPYIKSISVEALEKKYSTKIIALKSIENTIETFYKDNYPDIAASRKSDVVKSIAEVKNIYSRNYFPEMNVSWKRFPNHIGHMYSPGCFRCHDGKHVSNEGKILTKDCNTCHTILSQKYQDLPGTVQSGSPSLSGQEYIHPVDIGESWKEMNCSDCHSE